MNIDKILLKVSTLGIWNHQKDALRDILFYINSYNGKAFLVKMPTGTGKTGVFACLTRVLLPDSNYLIVTPSTALNQQIIRELKDDFWKKIGIDETSLSFKEILNLLPSNCEEIVDKIKATNFILVTTIQALQTIIKNVEHFLKLKSLIDFLIFDEGHKEPAYTWGQAIRSFYKPTILFSATPYRNDAKIFNFDKEIFYSLSHMWCQENFVLRSLKVIGIEAKTEKPASFIISFLSALNQIKADLQSQGIKSPKVVIRCEKQEEIRLMVVALRKLKYNVVGIHESFKKKGDFTDVVPSLEEQKKYDFFIHQYKLVEGIDNPEFCIVALYSEFGSSRLLIQQIGRILRNPTLKPNQFGYIITKNPVKIKEEWEKYLAYDSQISSRKKLFDVSDVLKVNRSASTLYFSGTFRELIDVKNLELTKCLLFQKKLNVFSNPNISADEIWTKIVDEWCKRDYSILKIENPESNVILILYIMYNNSPLVKDGIFIEQKLACTFAEVHKGCIYVYDTELNNPFSESEQINPVPREALLNLLAKKRKVTRTYLLNTDIGLSNLRSKDISANAIEYTAPGLADHGYFPSRMEAFVSNEIGTHKRYLGFQNGRITDFSAKRINYDEFAEWVKEIGKELHTTASNNGIFSLMNRFANKIDEPLETEPVSILFDIEQGVVDQFLFGKNREDVFIEDKCAAVNKGRFTIVINGRDFEFEIAYRHEYKKYYLNCSELDSYVQNVNEDGSSLISILNAAQSFRIIIKGNKYIYSYKIFFEPGLTLISKNRDLDLKQIFHSHSCIRSVCSEKGSPALLTSSDQWHKDTLFGLIGRLAQGYSDKLLESFFSFDHMLCDDLGNEIADFIAIDEKNKKVVLIHVKAGNSKLSASAFQEICGQAVKNLDYLIPYYAKNPNLNIAKWNKSWSLSGVGVARRVVKGNLTPAAFWKKYISMIQDPSFLREVWLVVGNMLDYDAFEREFKKTKLENVKPEAIQLVYLLRSTWNSVSSVGGQLKVFC